jgi:hypothetical protein
VRQQELALALLQGLGSLLLHTMQGWVLPWQLQVLLVLTLPLVLAGPSSRCPNSLLPWHQQPPRCCSLAQQSLLPAVMHPSCLRSAPA